MNNKFDELSKDLAQSVTRRGALKKFGTGVAGIALAALGLANKAEARWVSERDALWNHSKGPTAPRKWVCNCSALNYGCDQSNPVRLQACLNFCGPRC